ncbi:MAG: hypothetical protein IJS83_00150 [Acholeplasmatales bacterium]|nr:hypothetical protein [Acholeplasmatales bacterium]
MINKWDFTPSSGQNKGIADGNIEQFKGSIITSLARENCQNSLDAAISDEPVQVYFQLKEIDKYKVPGYHEYKEMIEKSIDTWKDSNKASKVLKKALDTIKKDTIPVLIISDYETKGIEGPYSTSLTSPWASITVTDGGATKSGNTGGSFGIGKNAPYAASDLRMVFYRTYNKNNEKAAQGLSRFVSFKYNKSEDKFSSGYGYFGNDNQKPIQNIEALDNIDSRTKVGSDIFIFGFNGEDNWRQEIVEAVLTNFLIPIYENKLEVVVDDIEISSLTLNDLIKDYVMDKKGELNRCYSNYLVLTNENTKKITRDFYGLGTLELSILIDSQYSLDKKMLVTRKTGMKLFHKSKISKTIPFSAILRLCGDELGEYFLELEPPTHDAWELDRASNKQEAKEYINEIEQWCRAEVLKLGAKTSTGDVSVDGLSENLAMSGSKDSANKVDALSITIDDLKIVQNQKSKVSGKFISATGDDINKSKKEKVPGRLDDPNGTLPGIRKPKGEKTRIKKERHRAVADPEGKDLVVKPQENGERKELESLRVIRTGQQKYELIFKISKNVSSGHICILSVGENNRPKHVKVISSTAINNITISSNESGNIFFSNISGNDKTKLSFEIDEKRNFAMEVEVYEH